jgi:hypothetical protein
MPMKNCLILGSGRSGTSMVAGTLSKAGYYMGENLMPATASNPKGYYESTDVEAINEDLLASVVPRRPGGLLGKLLSHRPKRFQRWLAVVPVGTEIPVNQQIAERIRHITAKRPFCFKDPRFCYTLPAWRPFLSDTVFVCVFRHPAATAQSILRNCAEEPYLKGLSINFARAIHVWTLMYRHVLDIHRHDGDWLFLHYDQAGAAAGLHRIERFLSAAVDRSFPEATVSRSSTQHRIAGPALDVYAELCALAGYTE